MELIIDEGPISHEGVAPASSKDNIENTDSNIAAPTGLEQVIDDEPTPTHNSDELSKVVLPNIITGESIAAPVPFNTAAFEDDADVKRIAAAGRDADQSELRDAPGENEEDYEII